jgi:hypothetical protein
MYIKGFQGFGARTENCPFSSFLRVINCPMMMKNDHSPSQARSTHTEVEKAWRFCVGAGHPSGIKKAINTPKHFTGQLFEGDSSDPWGNGTTVNRQSNDTRYVLRDLEQYYLPVRKRRQNRLFLEFSLCLSRACLGKNDFLIYKWLKKTVPETERNAADGKRCFWRQF